MALRSPWMGHRSDAGKFGAQRLIGGALGLCGLLAVERLLDPFHDWLASA
jgi:hypothetical protein